MVAAGKHLDWTDFCLISLSVAGSGLLLNTLSTIVPHLQVAAAEEHARQGWEAAARIPELEGQAGEVPLYCEKLKEAAAVRTVTSRQGGGTFVLCKYRGVVTCWLCCCLNHIQATQQQSPNLLNHLLSVALYLLVPCALLLLLPHLLLHPVVDSCCNFCRLGSSHQGSARHVMRYMLTVC